MSVKLISYTQSPDNKIQTMTDFIAFIDRSSKPSSNQENIENV